MILQCKVMGLSDLWDLNLWNCKHMLPNLIHDFIMGFTGEKNHNVHLFISQEDEDVFNILFC